MASLADWFLYDKIYDEFDLLPMEELTVNKKTTYLTVAYSFGARYALEGIPGNNPSDYERAMTFAKKQADEDGIEFSRHLAGRAWFRGRTHRGLHDEPLDLIAAAVEYHNKFKQRPFIFHKSAFGEAFIQGE